MEKQVNLGSPAFPFSFEDNEGNKRWAQGMWLRDYFAAKALQGMLAVKITDVLIPNDVYARDAYLIADAMLQARET